MKDIFMKAVKGFLDFVRQQGVMGLAVAFVLGGSVQKLVTALVNDIINPVIGVLLGKGEALADRKWAVGEIQILWGDFLKVLIDFLVIAAVVYVTVKVLGLEKVDKKKG